MIILKTLKWSNMFSYGDNNSIDFTKNTISQVVGFNGTGKTSILHVLEELLFNKNSKGYKKAAIANRNTKGNSYSGEVTFDVDSVPYTLVVKRTGSTQKVVLFKEEKDISQHTASATYDLIEKLFKMDFKTSSQIISQNSKSSLQFLTTTDTLRKKFLIDLLNYESYLEEYEKAKEVHKKEADKLKIIEAEYKHLKDWLDTNSKHGLDRMELLIVPSKPVELETKIKNLSTEIKDIENTISSIRKNNQYKEIRNAIPVELLTEQIETISLNQHRNSIAVLESEIITDNTKLTKIRKLKGKCHECMQDIHEDFTKAKVAECIANINTKTTEVAYLKEDMANISEQNKRATLIKKSIEDFEKYSALIDESLPTEEPDKAEMQATLTQWKAEYDAIVANIKKASDYNERAIANNAKYDLILSQKADIEKKIASVKSLVEEQTNLVCELEILKKALSTNGLVAYKIENSVKDLENMTNEYLAELSEGRFQLFFIISNDKLNVVIKDNGTNVDIEALSAGELSRVTTSTLLAIRKLMSSLSKSRINLLFLDETLDVLDSDGKEKLIDILVRETTLNTFLISHGYTHPLLSKIMVTKTNGISKVEQL